MENSDKKELVEYTDEDLLALANKPRSLERKQLSAIFVELRRRGYSEQVQKIEDLLKKTSPIYSRLLSRFAAYLIDILLLGVFGMILGLLLRSSFAKMGYQGLLVGFSITIAYFGVGNSNVFKGQTLGKKTLNLRVVNSDYSTLSVWKSLLRSSIYTIPFFFLNYRIIGWSELSASYVGKSIICLSFMIVLPIHLIINTPTRQALHDLFLGTYVINTYGYSEVPLGKSRILPTTIIGIIALLLISLFVFLNIRNSYNNMVVQELAPLKEKIDNLDKVAYSAISRNTSTTRQSGSDEISRSNYLRLNIIIKDNLISGASPDDIERISPVKDAIKIVLSDYEELNNLDFIQVSLMYGFNIGISKSSRSLTSSYSVDEWRQKIE
ncbi:MAG: RDD family protein [Bacteroidales bacterium]|nr:RDD family protein [Bacteroidales bacterium]